ncbi:HIT family protein [Thermomonospora umbrina]|uniref:HIT family protein n=1 Tax=Thermomonospora umbrina TaxID=111806 RepID=UPI000E287CD3
MTTCEFCNIIAGNTEARIVGDTSTALAFFPLSPAAIGHTLIVPKIHIRDIWALTPEIASDLMATILQVSHALRKSLQPDGLNLINSAGKAASQTVFHIHFHLVPRWENDNFGEIWPDQVPQSEERIDEVAALVRGELSDLAS